jgi:sugar lactone lactonase YvrE
MRDLVVADARVVTSARAELGEGPRWDARRGELVWVDILRGRVSRETVDADGALQLVRRYDVGTTVGAVAPVSGGDGWVVAAGRGVAHLGLGGRLTPIVDVAPQGRMNDASCDPQGRLWAGTIGDDARAGEAMLVRLDAAGAVTTVLEGLTISNGLGWSPDGRTMYHVDSGPGTLTAYAFDPATGDIRDPRVLLRLAADDGGVPDGLAVDADGDLWVGIFGAGEVRRYSPAGVLVGVVRVGAAQSTCPAFGGPRLDHLFITTATEGWSDEQRAAQPDAGAVFGVRVPARGRPAAAFRAVAGLLPE